MTAQTVTYRCPHCQQAVDVDLRPENELLVCPNEGCGKPFKVEIPTAEPLEGLIVPSTSETLPEAIPVPPVASAPTALLPDEVKDEPVQTIHLSMMRRYPFRSLGYVAFILTALIGAILLQINDHRYLALACLIVGGIVVYRFVLWSVRMKHTVLQITTRRCVVESGVFNKQSTEVPLQDIDDIQVHQTFIQRIFNVGDLTLNNKIKDSQRVVVMAVPSPRDVACLIRDKQPK